MSGAVMQRIPVFGIRRARAATRRQKISEHLASLGVEFRIIEGVDGRGLPVARQHELLAPGQSYHAGVLGCYLSHLAAYQAVVDEGLDAALVLEDDARLHPRVLPLLRQGCESLAFDYCFLDSDDHNDRGPVFYDRDAAVTLAPGIQAHTLSAGPQTLHAYLISQRGAAQRLKHALPILKPIDLYDHLPYAIEFRSIVRPKLAWVSEDSLESFTSERSLDPTTLSFAVLRRSSWFYKVRDLLQLKAFKAMREVSAEVKAGKLNHGRRWRKLPSGREVLF